MRTSDVDLAFLEPAKGKLACGRGGDNLYAGDLFHHSGKKTGGRVAPSQHEPFLSRFFLAKYNQVHAAIRPSGSLDNTSRLRSHRSSGGSHARGAPGPRRPHRCFFESGLTGSRRVSSPSANSLSELFLEASKLNQFLWGRLQPAPQCRKWILLPQHEHNSRKLKS